MWWKWVLYWLYRCGWYGVHPPIILQLLWPHFHFDRCGCNIGQDVSWFLIHPRVSKLIPTFIKEEWWDLLISIQLVWFYPLPWKVLQGIQNAVETILLAEAKKCVDISWIARDDPYVMDFRSGADKGYYAKIIGCNSRRET